MVPFESSFFRNFWGCWCNGLLVPGLLAEIDIDNFTNLLKGKMNLNQVCDVLVLCIDFFFFFKYLGNKKWLIVAPVKTCLMLVLWRRLASLLVKGMFFIFLLNTLLTISFTEMLLTIKLYRDILLLQSRKREMHNLRYQKWLSYGWIWSLWKHVKFWFFKPSTREAFFLFAKDV